MTTLEHRFLGIKNLYTQSGLTALAQSHVAVIGIGGVGSWAAEALARSGIGTLTIVDMDDICISNCNRQLHALEDTLGHSKVQIMAKRIKDINPDCQVHAIEDFFTQSTAETLLMPEYDYIIDAIDSLNNKALLVQSCQTLRKPLFVTGGAAGKSNPSYLQFADLCHSRNDALLRSLRQKLRNEYQFPRTDAAWGIPCVYSHERPRLSDTQSENNKSRARLDCQSGFGTASFLTGTFGLFAASYVVNALAGSQDAL